MHEEGFLHKMLSFVMHKKRLLTLSLLVTALLKTKKLSLTELGRGIDLPIQERSGIRRSDRFLGNKKLHQERKAISEKVIKTMIGSQLRPLIIADWSHIPNTTHQTLRAALVTQGRAISLYEEVHLERDMESKIVHNNFLDQLKKMFPKNCRPIIITDAGFHNDWFKKVFELGWDYVGRVRGNKTFCQSSTQEWRSYSSVFKKANTIPISLGRCKLCTTNPLETNLYLYKGKRKGRKLLNRLGQKSRDSDSLEYAKAAREPWLLATSLAGGYTMAKRIVRIYQTRMQIEEGFRDLKSSRYGFSFEQAHSNDIARIEVLLLIAMLASLIAWLTGWVGEKKQWHLQFQSNSIKNRRVLSLFSLGCRMIIKHTEIPISWFYRAVSEGLVYEI